MVNKKNNFLRSVSTHGLSLIFAFSFHVLELSAQNESKDPVFFSAADKSELQFFLEDTYLFGGINSSGIFYSNNFRHLSYIPGFNFGVEHYRPLKGKVFLSTGINFSQRGFLYHPAPFEVRAHNYYLELPVQTAFEIPIFRHLDFRIFFGASAGVRTHTTSSSNLESLSETYSPPFLYEPERFSRFDFGWNFGLSAEYNNFIFRFRSFSGFSKLDPKDQGMMNSFQFEVGYFLFRKIYSRP
jgi:hypothetical protein